jgi:hypothetical protein
VNTATGFYYYKGKQLLIDKPEVVLASYNRIIKKESGIDLYTFLHMQQSEEVTNISIHKK